MSPRPQHHVFDEASLEERSTPEENRPFFLERKENGLNPKLTINTDDDDEIRRTSPYAFHYFNENLEIRPDLFLIHNEDDDDDDEDEGNLRPQMRGNLFTSQSFSRCRENECAENNPLLFFPPQKVTKGPMMKTMVFSRVKTIRKTAHPNRNLLICSIQIF